MAIKIEIPDLASGATLHYTLLPQPEGDPKSQDELLARVYDTATCMMLEQTLSIQTDGCCFVAEDTQ
jgi:hypothetical protein